MNTNDNNIKEIEHIKVENDDKEIIDIISVSKNNRKRRASWYGRLKGVLKNV